MILLIKVITQNLVFSIYMKILLSLFYSFYCFLFTPL